jgi:uncharacterized protein YbcI
MHPSLLSVTATSQPYPPTAGVDIGGFRDRVYPGLSGDGFLSQSDQSDGGRPKGEMAASISTGLVQLHRQYYGKGPTKAKTHFVNDTVICILEGGFTTVERTLIADGQADMVHNLRRSFQKAMEVQFTNVIEQTTERRVIAYMSQVHENPDLAVELFVLERGAEPVLSEHEVELAEPTA